MTRKSQGRLGAISGILISCILTTSLAYAIAPPAAVADSITGPVRAEGAPDAPSEVVLSTPNFTTLEVGFNPTTNSAVEDTSKFFVTVTRPTQATLVYELRRVSSTVGWQSYQPGGSTVIGTNVCDTTTTTPTRCTLSVTGSILGAGEYSATVTALNTAGASPESYSNTLTNYPPSVEPAISGVSTDGVNLLVSYTPVSNEAGKAPVQGHGVVLLPPAGPPRMFSINTAGVVYETTSGSSVIYPLATTNCSSSCTLILPVAAASGAYAVSMFAYNLAGNGPSSSGESSSQAELLRPTVAVEGLEAGINDAAILVYFNHAINPPGLQIIDRYDVTIAGPSGVASVVQIKRTTSGGVVSWTGYKETGGALPTGTTASCTLEICTVSLATSSAGSYEVTVEAGNSLGNGPPETDAAQMSRPSAVEGLEMHAAGADLTTQFNLAAPAPGAGPAVTGYTITIHKPSGLPIVYQIRQYATGDWRPYQGGSATPVSGFGNICQAGVCSLVTQSLTGPGPYWVEAYAVSLAGNSPVASTSVLHYELLDTITPLFPAAPAMSDLAQTGTNNLQTTFTATGADSYSLVLKSPNFPDKIYRVYKTDQTWYMQPVGGTATSSGVTCTTTGCTILLTGVLSSAGIYAIEVTATNSIGNSLPSSKNFTNTPPATPLVPGATFSGQNATVTWSEPASLTPITSYTVIVNQAQGGYKSVSVTPSVCISGVCSTTITAASSFDGLHKVEVTAINSAGNSGISDPYEINVSAGTGIPAICAAYTGLVTPPNFSAAINTASSAVQASSLLELINSKICKPHHPSSN